MEAGIASDRKQKRCMLFVPQPMAGTVKHRSDAERRQTPPAGAPRSRSFARQPRGGSSGAATAWGPLVAVALSVLLLALAAWLLVRAHPWATP